VNGEWLVNEWSMDDKRIRKCMFKTMVKVPLSLTGSASQWLPFLGMLFGFPVDIEPDCLTWTPKTKND